jgi:hypothetical protein
MSTKNTRSKKPRPQSGRNGQDMVSFADVKTKQIRSLKRKDFEAELKKIYDTISATLPRIGKLGKYELKDIELSVGVSGNFVVVTVEGGIVLRYSLP